MLDQGRMSYGWVYVWLLMQAHSWVPRLLMELHGRACGIHKRLKDLLASVAGSALLGAPSLTPTGMAHRRSANGGSGSLGGQWSASGALLASPDVQRTYDLMDEMQERFASLVLNNFQRTAWLCNAVVVPAMWALEVLKDQVRVCAFICTCAFLPARNCIAFALHGTPRHAWWPSMKCCCLCLSV